MSKTILVIGGNAAGPAAAAKAKRTSPMAEVILLEKESFISTGTCELPFLFSGEISDYKNLVFYSPEKFKSEKVVDVKINHFVRNLHPKEKIVEIENLENNKAFKIKYDSLVLATGSVAKKVAGLDYSLENVFTFKTISDYLKIDEYRKSNTIKTVTIIGAGYIGVELAEAFTHAGLAVNLIEREKNPFPFADSEVQTIIAEVIKNSSIRLLTDVKKNTFITSENRITSINCDGRIIETDILITSTGFEPNNFLTSNAKLRTGAFGGLITDTRLRTSDFSIFAAGDNIEVQNFITNKYDYFPQASLAHNFGHVAGSNAAGASVGVDKVIKNISVKVFNSFYSKVGLSSNEAEENNFIFSSVSEVLPNLIKVMPGSRPVFGKIIYDKRNKTILGAEFFGGREVSGYADIVAMLIRNKIPATNLQSTNYNYTPPLSPFINILSVLGRKISS